MSLAAALADAARSLGAARRLYGPRPMGGRWQSTDVLVEGRDSTSGARLGAAQYWGGSGQRGYRGAARHGTQALAAIAGADAGTGHGLGAGPKHAAAGRAGMGAVISDARAGVAALAPTATTPAGRRELITHLSGQLSRANALLRLSQRQDIELAALLRAAAGGYGRQAVGTASPPITAAGGSPSLAPGRNSAAISRPLTAPGTPQGRSRRMPGLHLAAFTGAGPERIRAVVRAALDVKGITDPAARARWEAGMMLVAQRESNFGGAGSVNRGDINASLGHPSAGTWQFTGPTFHAYHEPGTSASHTDDLAQACAFINYAHRRYHVHLDGSNLAANIQQADPTRPPRGY